MSSTIAPIVRPVTLQVPPAAGGPATPGAPAIAVIVVTWNRRREVDKVLQALARQDFGPARMHLFVVDSNSTDGTVNMLQARWRPELILDNATDRAETPRFEPMPGAEGGPNAGGFASLTIVHNHANLGGCGGFNTGFACVSSLLVAAGTTPEFVWLVDDDVDLPPDALSQLTSVAATDPKIGIVGSRTVDILSRRSTIETTIYLDRRIGAMGDAPPPGHPQYESHQVWVKQVGGTRGDHTYSGTRDVDVVSACSMLARWSAVEKVGFWDRRYFIYCDDADWCLRFGRAGYRVVLNLDAKVYHTPWNLKLTVARIYYAQRNLMWMIQKVLPARALRYAMARHMCLILRDSLRASIHRRLFHAEVLRRTAIDAATNRAGKLDRDGPPPEPTVDLLRQAGAVQKGARPARIGVLCSIPGSVELADQLRAGLGASLAPSDAAPLWTYYIRNNIPDPGTPPGLPPAERVVYGGRWPSRLRRQLSLLRRRPRIVVVFDQTTDFPAVAGRWNLHIDSRGPDMGQLERDGPARRLAFLFRWLIAAARCGYFILRLRPYTSATRYG